MENAHAHPSSPADTTHSRSRSVSTLAVRDHPHNLPTTTPRSVPNTRQQRLLHTRHARFSAQRLSVNGITFPSLIRPCENDSPHFTSPRLAKQDENAALSDRSSDLTGTSPTSTILNEIANFAACRKRSLHHRPPIPVFKDSSEQISTPILFQDASSSAQAFSTESIEEFPADMGLKEVSANLQRPSSKGASPYYASPRSSAHRKSSQLKSRFNSEEYIQHIENELEMVKDAMYSPNTHLPWKEKLKKAKQENDQLKKELRNIKTSFEFELRETVERLTENELRLKRKIRDLEEDVEQKDMTIQELEYHHEESRRDQSTMDALKTRIDKLEEERATLELTNRGMTKRNEVLTQLLALSPTKSHHGIELPTPRRRNARPMSLIIPRVPSSPVERTPLSRPQSVLVSPGHAVSDYFSRYSLSSPVVSSPPGVGHLHNMHGDDGQSVDSGLGDSCSHVTAGTASRRSTLASHVSSSPELLPSSHAQYAERPSMPAKQPSKRRPRKFMPGSTQLKPLLLPTFTAENGNLPSASPLTSPDRPLSGYVDRGPSYTTRWEESYAQPRGSIDGDRASSPSAGRKFIVSEPGPSFQSLDEVFTRMGESLERDPINETPSLRDHPAQGAQESSSTDLKTYALEKTPASRDQTVPRPRVRSWVLKTTPTPPSGPSAIYDHGHPAIERRIFSGSIESLRASSSSEPYKSDSELDMSSVEVPRPLFSRTLSRPVDQDYLASRSHFDQSPLHPRKRRKADSRTDVKLPPEEPGRGYSEDSAPPDSPRPRLTPRSVLRANTDIAKKHRQSSLMPKPGRPKARNSFEMLQQRNIGSRPLAAITIQTVYTTLSRYTSYIQTFKRDPLALARRVIANAWRSNWAMFGKMSWWVLGLFISRRVPISDDSGWDWEHYDGESIAHRYCAEGHDAESHDIGPSFQDTDAGRLLNEENIRGSKSTSSQQNKSENVAERTTTGWGKSLFLWGKFSVAIMLAVGGAIVRGPAEMLRETEDQGLSPSKTIDQNRGTSSNPSTRPRPEYEALFDRRMNARVHSREVDLDGTISPTSTRKARSFSSPTPSPGDHRAVPVSRSMLKQSNAFADPVVDRSTISHDLLVDNDESTANIIDETLKPKRSERKGLDSVFQSSDNECVTQSIEPLTTDSQNGIGPRNIDGNIANVSDYG